MMSPPSGVNLRALESRFKSCLLYTSDDSGQDLPVGKNLLDGVIQLGLGLFGGKNGILKRIHGWDPLWCLSEMETVLKNGFVR